MTKRSLVKDWSNSVSLLGFVRATVRKPSKRREAAKVVKPFDIAVFENYFVANEVEFA